MAAIYAVSAGQLCPPAPAPASYDTYNSSPHVFKAAAAKKLRRQPVKTLAIQNSERGMQPFEHRVRTLMVQRDRWDIASGPRKVFFNSRPGSPATSFFGLNRLPAFRCSWGRLGSVYTCKRLHHMRRRFKHFQPFSQPPAPLFAIFGPGFCFQGCSILASASIASLQYRHFTHYGYLEKTHRSRSAPEKSVQFGPDGAPFP